MRTSRAILGCALGAASAAATWAVACLDLDPVTVQQVRPTFDVYIPPLPDVMLPDGADAAAFDVVDPRGPCQKCVESPDEAGGCEMDLTACTAIPSCAEVYGCALQFGCLYLPTPQSAIECILPCIQEAGINSAAPGTPGAVLLTLANCALLTCNMVCWPNRDGGFEAGL